MKQIEVVAAVIKDGNRIFATQRGYGEFKDKWEFPAGQLYSVDWLPADIGVIRRLEPLL